MDLGSSDWNTGCDVVKLGMLLKQVNRWMAFYFPIWGIRRAFLGRIGVKVGTGTYVEPGAIIHEDTVIGDKCYIGNHVKLEGHTRIGNRVRIEAQCHITSYSRIDDGVFFGPCVCSGNDRRMTYLREGHGSGFEGITIHRYARIGAAAMLLPGTKIGEFAVVGSMALVTKDVKPHTLVVGAPAREVEDKTGLTQMKIIK